MKKWILVACLVMFLAVNVGTALAGGYGHGGPAPNSGDCVSDGSGFDDSTPAGNPDAPGKGPAPNSGDGVSDGSGF